MLVTVVIDMKNPNALISMAIVSQNADNPYSVFCEYIKYCIFTNNTNTMSISEVRDAVSNEFGILIPYNVTTKCLSVIEKDGGVSQFNHQIKRIGTFDVAGFARERDSYRETETALIDALISYVKEYGKDWGFEYAREQLIKVLDKKGLAYDIFLHGNVRNINDRDSALSGEELNELLPDEDAVDSENVEKQPLFSDEFFVGRFIQQTISTDNAKKDYLQKICTGLMLCAGIYQLPSVGGGVAVPPIKNTEFFFDTRLLLRFIGCAGNAAVEAAKELVKLIQNGGGRVCYYPQTLEEMHRAFDDAIWCLSNNFPPRDEEMRVFAASQNNRIAVLRAKRAGLVDELSNKNIYLRQHETFSDSDRISFGFSRDDLEHYMEENLDWEPRTIENDAYSLWETHMRRAGNYSEYCGTNLKLPVFVTTNSRLIGVALGYRNARPSTKEIFQWKSNRLPVITDIRLTCRLWIPSEQSDRLPLLHLAANALAAQRPTQKYLNSLRSLVTEFEKTVPEYSGIPLPSYFDDNVTSALLEKTGGNEEKFNLGTLASSLAELSELKAKDQEKITEKVKSELEKVSTEYNNQTKSIIAGAVDKNKNKLGWIRIILVAIIWWRFIATAIFAGLSTLVSYYSGNWKLIWVSAPIIALAIAEEISTTEFVKKWAYNLIYPKINTAYDKRIIKRLREVEIPYKDEIIEQVKRQTNLWVKCMALNNE